MQVHTWQAIWIAPSGGGLQAAHIMHKWMGTYSGTEKIRTYTLSNSGHIHSARAGCLRLELALEQLRPSAR